MTSAQQAPRSEDTVTVDPVTPAEHPLVERLWQLYQHDLSEFRGTVPSSSATYKTARLEEYLADDPDVVAYLVRAGDQPAGFVLVRGTAGDLRVLAEFFVVRGMRRSGVGRRVALGVLRRHPGRWEIAFQEENPGAARFWRGIATDVAGDSWREERRPVPDKPHIPHDVWISLEAPPG